MCTTPLLPAPLLSLCMVVLLACGDAPSGTTDASPGDTTAGNGTTADTTAQQECIYIEDGFGPEGDADIQVEEVVTGLEVPWGIAFLPEGDMLVTERPGRIRLVEDGTLVPEPVANVDITAGGEGGLLGIAAHPDFEDNRFFYVYYTTTDVNQVERWRLSDDGRSAEADRVIVGDIPSARFHNGGRLRFGPDDMLYIGTGDAGTPDNAQDRGTLAGKLLRVTPDGEVPDDNPFADSPVYLTGIRNTQGWAFPDASTIWLTDHGPSGELGRRAHDEVSVADPGDNLGWPDIYRCETAPDMVTPSITWSTAVPPGGADVYTGDAIPEWEGDLLVGTLGSRHLHRFAIGEGGGIEQHDVYLQGDPPEGYGRLREVIMGPDGHVYVTTSNCDGRGACPANQDKILRIR